MSGTPNPTIRGYVLAGGASARFGRDKALVEFDGQPMLLRMRELLAGVLGNVTVVANPGKYGNIAVDCVADRWPGEGPLGGIITALMTTSELSKDTEWNLIVGCDMPFLTRDWLQYLTQRAAPSDAEVIAPRSGSGLEPLCACWRTTAAPKLHQAFDEKVRKITEAMGRLKTEIVDETGWKQFDSAGRLFWNMNTPADYEEARRIREAEHA
jgi:molybdenum cofactor guanylyltransferase